MNAVLNFDTAGIVTCLYTELIPLREIGPLTVSRITQIEFNNETQLWECKDTQQNILFSHRSRKCCLHWEHHHYGRNSL